ncbi:MAG: hypothetical protein QXE01_10455, partial [Sulfolobales archaeon]
NVVWYTSYTAPLLALSTKICRGEVFLDESYSIYVDVVEHSSNYLFAGPIGLPLLISIPACIARIGGNQLLVGGIVVSIFGLISTILTYALTRLYSERYALASTLIASLGGILWIYSSHIFPQAPLTFSMLLTIYLGILVIRRGAVKRYIYLLLGLSSSIALLMDPMALLASLSVCAVIAIYIARKLGVRVFLQGTMLWLAGFMPLAIVQMLYNLAAVGDPLSFPETLLLKKIGVDGFLGISVNPIYGLYMLIIDPRKGLIPLYPVLGAGLIMLPRFLVSIRSIYERAVFAIYLASYAIPHSMWYDFDGGLSYGPRFLVPITPILAPPIQLLLIRWPRGRALVIALSIFSIFTNSIVVTVTPYPCALEDMVFPSNQFISCVLPRLLEGIRAGYLYEILRARIGDLLSLLGSVLVLGISSTALILYTARKKI